jgi:hypothetical protein
VTERERRRTRNGEAIRTADGWTWLCDLCHRTMHIGVGADVELDVGHLLQSMDDAHWCEKKRRPA